MEDGDLLGVYRDYLACLNNRQWNELGHFVADGVVYNGELLGIKGYRAMLGPTSTRSQICSSLRSYFSQTTTS